METTVNQRVIDLKKELKLNDIEFCGKAEISTFTLHKIKNDEEVKTKIINSIINAYNVNPEWMYKGIGNMFNDTTSVKFVDEDQDDPWKDVALKAKEETITVVKAENSRLEKELSRVWGMVQHLMEGKMPDFLKATKGADLSMQHLPGESFNRSSVAHA